jgi:hypothetical protein
MGPDTEPLKVDTPPVEPQAPAPAAETSVVADTVQVVGSSLLRLLERIMFWLGAQVIRPKVRSVIVGLLLILIGAELINHSVWTFPIVILGILMIVVAWVGSRLEGRFGIEWNEDGAGFEMRARFKARAPQLRPAPPLPAPSHSPASTATATPPVTPAVTTAMTTAGAVSVDPEDENVIEGEAHTIEIDVDELKALIAAAELASADTATTNGTPVSWQAVSSGIDR